MQDQSRSAIRKDDGTTALRAETYHIWKPLLPDASLTNFSSKFLLPRPSVIGPHPCHYGSPSIRADFLDLTTGSTCRGICAFECPESLRCLMPKKVGLRPRAAAVFQVSELWDRFKFKLSLDTMVIVELAVAIVATVLLTAALVGDPKGHLTSLCQWLKGQVSSGKNKLPDYSKLTGIPPPKPMHDFDIDSAKPRPYRPFRWEYHQTMCKLLCRCDKPCPRLTVLGALKKLEPDWWIELHSTYREQIDQRKKLYAKHGKLVMDELPGSQEASREYMEMVIQYVCQRYPNQFHYNDWTGVFSNNILGLKVDINTVHPFMFLLEHIPEDVFIVQEDPETGLYVLRAGVACSAVGWNMNQKIGRPLHQVHGPVPDYKEKMAFSMDR